MRHRALGCTSLSVSELSLGTWGLSGEGYGVVSEADQGRVIERSRALGINLFETADSYGRGAMERRLGACLAGDTAALVCTKVGTDLDPPHPRKRFDPAYLAEALGRSAERLGRTQLDIVLLHNPSTRCLERGEATNFLREAARRADLRCWGVSIMTADQGRAALAEGAMVLALPHNVLHCTALRSLEPEIERCQAGVLAHSVLAYGLLCGHWSHDKTFADDDHRRERWGHDGLRARIQQLNGVRPIVGGSVMTMRAGALRFALSSAQVSSVVLGPRNPLQLDQLVREAGSGPPYLTADQLSGLEGRLAASGVPR
jgi:aryl-alcohol dehydrogenase-like predicted oxidoreductase